MASAEIYMSAQKNVASGLHFELLVRNLMLQRRNFSCNARKIHFNYELALFSVIPFAATVNARCEARQAGSVIFDQQHWMHTRDPQALEGHRQGCDRASVGILGLTGQPSLPSHAEGLLQAPTV